MLQWWGGGGEGRAGRQPDVRTDSGPRGPDVLRRLMLGRVRARRPGQARVRRDLGRLGPALLAEPNRR
jgi:hypothetical protein